MIYCVQTQGWLRAVQMELSAQISHLMTEVRRRLSCLSRGDPRLRLTVLLL